MLRLFMIMAAIMLSLLGLCEILHITCVLVLRPQRKSDKILVLFPKKDNCEQQLMLALHELSWHGNNYADKVAVITEELDFEEKKTCAERFSGDNIIFAENFEDLKKIYQRI